jgi:hypothetical protein
VLHEAGLVADFDSVNENATFVGIICVFRGFFVPYDDLVLVKGAAILFLLNGLDASCHVCLFH